MIIYKATNTLNSKVYIGKTIQTFEQRISKHYSQYKSQRYAHVVFYKALRKHGWDAFTWEIIDTAESPDDLNQKEQFWINSYRSYLGFQDCNGYNSTLGGEGINGWNHSDISKEKVRQANLGKKYSKDHRLKLSRMHKQRVRLHPEQVCRGEHCHFAVLSEEQVSEIIEHLNDKTHRISELAKMYSVHRATIAAIKSGETWSHIPREVMGNFNIGVNHHSHVLSVDDVINIKQRVINGEKKADLAREYGITQQSLRKIVTGESWSHVRVKGEESLREKTSRSHLQTETVIQIKTLIMQGAQPGEIAELFGIAVKRVSAIKTGHAYTAVEVQGFTPFAYRLTDEDLEQIKMLLHQGVKSVHIAKRFKVSDSLISNIKLGKVHSQIEPVSK